MLSDLKYLAAAVARKDFDELLCHFHFLGGRGWAFDGIMSASCLTPNISLTVRPHGATFVKAIQACGEGENAIAMHVTAAGKLSIKSGSFKTFVHCLDPFKGDDESIIPKPQGDVVPITTELLASIKELAPFMSIDASRPQFQGLRILGGITYATNNIILAQRFHGATFPYEIVIPSEFVKTVIKIDQLPVKAQVTESSLTFWYENERWIRTQLVVGAWPESLDDNLDRTFEASKATGMLKPLPEGFFAALETLRPFMDDRQRVFFYPDRLATSDIEEEASSVDIATGLTGQLFHLEYLRMLEHVVKEIDFTLYPGPCPFKGAKLRGVIIGQRQ